LTITHTYFINNYPHPNRTCTIIWPKYYIVPKTAC